MNTMRWINAVKYSNKSLDSDVMSCIVAPILSKWGHLITFRPSDTSSIDFMSFIPPSSLHCWIILGHWTDVQNKLTKRAFRAANAEKTDFVQSFQTGVIFALLLNYIWVVYTTRLLVLLKQVRYRRCTRRKYHQSDINKW